MTGMNKYDEKTKRKIRRTNHVARDLRTLKYRQRIVEKRSRSDEDYTFEDWDEYFKLKDAQEDYYDE